VAWAGSEPFQSGASCAFRPRLKWSSRASHTYYFLSRPCVHGKGNQKFMFYKDVVYILVSGRAGDTCPALLGIFSFPPAGRKKVAF